MKVKMDVFDVVNYLIDEDDDEEVEEVLDLRIPRKVYVREDYFNSFEDNDFFKRFRLTKETVLQLLIQIEANLEYYHNL